ncbi:hypothetical protein CS388_01685 [Porphyromonas gingivalis]|nr:hypothetical protein CS545_06885 [Porphyromonas gingivalis]ATS07871.1 hypothetical protein CS388_01685 [Porphyromonas gingivalis]
MRSSFKQLLKGGIYNYFHSLLPPLSLAPFMRRIPLYSISLFFKGLERSNLKHMGTKQTEIFPSFHRGMLEVCRETA